MMVAEEHLDDCLRNSESMLKDLSLASNDATDCASMLKRANDQLVRAHDQLVYLNGYMQAHIDMWERKYQ